MSTEISAWLKAGVDDQSTEHCENANFAEVRCRVLRIASDIKAIHAGYQPSYGVFNGICHLRKIILYQQHEDNNVIIASMLFSDEHGHSMLSFQAFIEVCPGLYTDG
jgi:hypothetical protein